MQPEEQSVKANLQAIGRSIQLQLPGKHWGFILLTFPFGEGGTCLYLANCRREDAIQAMREFFAKNIKNEQAFTDQGENTMADKAFTRWWQVEVSRIQREELEKPSEETIKQLCLDAFYAGMVWSVET